MRVRFSPPAPIDTQYREKIKMVKAKATKKAVAKKVTKKATKNDWWFQDVGDNVMRNAEEISANIRKNAEQISANIQANSQRISDNMKAYLNRNLSK
jgi:transcription termination factor NusB